MGNGDEPADEPRYPISRFHRVLLRLGVPRFMADHAAALVAANRRRRPPDRG
ncbi:hypothetical protein [Spirillospora sp. CA-294931]|uniref:hypothetical protein n=1 Tax=Spirillospora sp. CA-294931 TaxID=3240042 RepID=UPI003D8BDF8C